MQAINSHHFLIIILTITLTCSIDTWPHRDCFLLQTLANSLPCNSATGEVLKKI